MQRLLFHTVNFTLSFFGKLSETPYSLLFVRIRFNDVCMPPLCHVLITAFDVFTHGP